MDVMDNNSTLAKQVQFQAMAMISIHRIVSRIHSEMFEGTYAPSHEQKQGEVEANRCALSELLPARRPAFVMAETNTC